MTQVADLLGMGASERVREWCRQVEVAAGKRPGVMTEESAELKRLRPVNAELKRARAILKTASVFFAAELDRHSAHDDIVRASRRHVRRGMRS